MKKLLDLFFPPRCAVCGEVLTLEERNGFLCHECAEEIPYFPKEKCPHCGGETNNTGFCDFCVKHYAFESACAAFPYETVRDAIHLFKYDGDKTIGYGLGELMAEYLLKYHEELLVKTDIMVSVPLHPKKEKFRGFNQTHILCERISEKTGLVFGKKVLERKRETIAQSELNPEERKLNLKDAFGVTADVAGKRVLLVDDIFTTGTTCNECATALYRAGAQEVMVFALSAAGTE
ncbi:ComF family protein [Anaerotignum sp.]